MQTIPASQVVPPTDPNGRIYQTVRGTLDAYVNYFGEREVALPTDELGDVVAFVSDGDPVYNGPMLVIDVVSLNPGAPGLPSSAAIAGGTEYSITATLALLRDVPKVASDGVPHRDKRDDAAKMWLRDWAMLFEGALTMTGRAMEGNRGTLVGAPYRRVMIQNMVPYGPEGGLGGTIATLVMELI